MIFHFNPYADLPEVPDDLSQEERESLMVQNTLIGCVGFILVPIVVMIVVFLLGGCAPARTIERESVRTDTVVVNNTQRDSIFVETLRHDSIFVQVKGDTVIFTHWRTEYRDRWRDRLIHDSIYIAHTDTLRTETTVEVPQRLSIWQRTRMAIGTLALLLISLVAVAHVVALCSRRN